MNIKDVTTTSFGLIVAYLLPGLAGLYTVSLYFPGAGDLFRHTNDAVGFLLLLLVALLTGVLLHGVHILGLSWLCSNMIPIGAENFRKLQSAEKLACFMAVLDEYYRANQFWGSMALIVPFFYIGSGIWDRYGILSLIGFLLIWVLTIVVAVRIWYLYVDVGQKILKGP